MNAVALGENTFFFRVVGRRTEAGGVEGVNELTLESEEVVLELGACMVEARRWLRRKGLWVGVLCADYSKLQK